MMPSASSKTTASAVQPKPLRVGYLALTDAAPFVAAEHLGLFARHRLNVELRREIGWATIREKIAYGELDAAQAPAPMLWSIQLGLGCSSCDVLTALVLSLHGNALTLSTALWNAGVRDGVSLRSHIRAHHTRQPLTLGGAFRFSSHHLLMLEWLRAAGLEPDRDVRIVVVPPAQMFRNLAAGTIDGYYAGEPWNTLAVREGAGWCPTWSSAQSPGHLEKILLVTRRFAETRASEHAALISALLEACAWCDEPQNREPLAQLLSEPRYLNLSTRVIAPALLGRFACGHDRVERVPDFHVFHHGDINVPIATKATALQRDLGAAGLLSPSAANDPELPHRLFREDIYREVVRELAVP